MLNRTIMNGAGLALLAASAAVGQTVQVFPLRPESGVVSEHGATVAALPDVTGDGVADIAVGSYSGSGDRGRVYIYSGSNGQRVRSLASPHPEIDGLFAHSISAVPDTNGDGVADIAVGAANHSPGSSPDQCGRVYLYSGATGALLHKMLPSSPVLYGQFGYSVAGISDVNGDGFGDVVIGAPYERSRNYGGSVNSGRVHIYSGATGRRIRSLHSAGEQGDGHFGESVAVTPDADGDGQPDIIVGSPKERPDKAGRVYLFRSNGSLIRKILPPSPVVEGRFGDAVASVPDTDGDGRYDIVVGAERMYNRSGRAYLFSGATGQLRFAMMSAGNQVDGRFGKAVAGMPDTNGDGRGDVIVGAYHEEHQGSRTGRIYVYSGLNGQLLRQVTSPVFESEELGHGVAGMPDTNGNGIGEVVGGAPDHESGSYGNSGMAWHFRY